MSNFLDRARFARDHRWAPGRMSDYLDAELTPGAIARMDRHTDECVQCRKLLAGLRAMLGAIGALPAPSGGPDAAQIAASVRVRLNGPPAP